MPQTTGLLTNLPTRLLDTPGARLTISLAFYGGALGAGALVVSRLALRAADIWPKEPEHLPLIPGLILSSAGFLVGALIAGIVTYWIAHDRPDPLHPLIWLALGFGFGILVPLFTGLIFPIAMVFTDLYLGTIEFRDLFIRLVDSIFLAPWGAVLQGAFGLFSSLLAGLVFAVGAWLVDRANMASKSWLSRYGTYGLAAALSVAVIGFVAFGSPSFLAKLG